MKEVTAIFYMIVILVPVTQVRKKDKKFRLKITV